MGGLRMVALALLIGGPAAAQPRPASEPIGSWVLACPAGGVCRLRHEAWVLAPGPGRPSVSLEVLRRGGRFVPAVAVRGLTTEAAFGGVLALNADVGLSFDGGGRVALVCNAEGGAIVCAPEGVAAAGAAAALATAHTVLVQMRLSLPGVVALPEQSRTLDLRRTAEALVRFQATGPADATVPALPGLDWRGLMDRVLRAAGLEHGVAELLASLGGWIGGGRP